jgi:hypothetical protein
MNNMFSNIKCLRQNAKTNTHFIDIMKLADFSKIKIKKSKIENYKAGRIILNNFYF